MAPTIADPGSAPAVQAGPLVFIVAGETSGDHAAARLMARLAARSQGRVRFAGIGGPAMADQGLASLFPMTDLSLMGLTEILPHLPRVLRRLRQTLVALRRLKPDLVLFIDCSAFARAVARRYRGQAPLVQYKAPQAWAYWPWRARTMARYFDHVLTILPFEPAFFGGYGVRSSYIGHPAIESGADRGDGPGFRRRHGIAAGDKLLAVLPGSRASEIAWSLPLLGEAVARLCRADPALRILVPTVDSVAGAVRRAVAGWPGAPIIAEGAGERYDGFAAADAALAVNGTATVELALARVPMVVCYRVSALTAAILRRMMLIRHTTIVNLVLDRPAIRELLQENCDAEKLAAEGTRLLHDAAYGQAIRAAYDEAVAALRPPQGGPSERAAEVVLTLLGGADPDRPAALSPAACARIESGG